MICKILQDDLQNFHSIYEMDKMRGSLCLDWKRIYRLVRTGSSDSDAIVSTGSTNRATEGKNNRSAFSL